jgi:hypothetical protein
VPRKWGNQLGVFLGGHVKNKKRLNYIINFQFQLKFILYTLIPSIVCLAIFYIALDIYFAKLTNQGIASGLQSNHPYFSLIADQKSLMKSLFLLCAGFSLLFFIGWGVFISHKIAGPISRLTRFFEEIDTPHFKKRLAFRPSDFFQEIPLAINRWMDKNHRP